MRAHWIKDLAIEDSYVLKDDAFHHLVHVVRLEANDELLLLNGKGLLVTTLVEAITKREIRLKYRSHHETNDKLQLDLALGMPKKEALELCLKQATELGFRKIYLIRSEYSQMKIPDSDRIEKILVSALEQSNAPFLPEVIETKWDSIAWKDYSEAVMLDSQTKTQSKINQKDPLAPRLLIVGPEGGFSPAELGFLHSQESVRVVNLPTPILRTPTALAAGAGVMMISLLK